MEKRIGKIRLRNGGFDKRKGEKIMVSYLEERNMETENEFLEKINSVIKNIVGKESYGGFTEFYDEDGVVLMRAEESDDGLINFSFSGDTEIFSYEEVDEGLAKEISESF